MHTRWWYHRRWAALLFLAGLAAMVGGRSAQGQRVVVRRGNVIQPANLQRDDSLIPGTPVVTGSGALVIVEFEWPSDTNAPCMRWDIISGARSTTVGAPDESGTCHTTESSNAYARWQNGEVFVDQVVFWGEGKADGWPQNSAEIGNLLTQLERENEPAAPQPDPQTVPQSTAGSLGSFNGIVDLAASYNRDDQNSVVLVATQNGDVHEVYYQGSGPAGQSVIAHFDGIVAIAASYNADDQYRVAIVATRDGDVHEVYYHPTKGKGQSVIAHFTDIVDLAAFFNNDDQYRVVLVATRNGQVHEVFYHPQKGRGQSVIATYNGIASLAGNFVPGSNARRVLTLTTDGRVHELLYGPGQARQERLLGQYPGATMIAGSGRRTLIVTGTHTLVAIPTPNGGPSATIATEPGLRWVAVNYQNAQDLVYGVEGGGLYRLH